MSSPRLPAATANLGLDASIGTLADNGYLRIYSGVQPVIGGGAITSQVKLVEFRMAADAFPPASGGILTANGIASALGLSNGTASWYRLLKSDGSTVLIDGSVGVSGSPDVFDVTVDTVTIVINEVQGVGSYTITQPLA